MTQLYNSAKNKDINLKLSECDERGFVRYCTALAQQMRFWQGLYYNPSPLSLSLYSLLSTLYSLARRQFISANIISWQRMKIFTWNFQHMIVVFLDYLGGLTSLGPTLLYHRTTKGLCTELHQSNFCFKTIAYRRLVGFDNLAILSKKPWMMISRLSHERASGLIPGDWQSSIRIFFLTKISRHSR